MGIGLAHFLEDAGECTGDIVMSVRLLFALMDHAVLSSVQFVDCGIWDAAPASICPPMFLTDQPNFLGETGAGHVI